MDKEIIGLVTGDIHYHWWKTFNTTGERTQVTTNFLAHLFNEADEKDIPIFHTGDLFHTPKGLTTKTFYEFMTRHDSLKDVLSYAQENYRLGYHKAASFAEILLEHEVKVISDLPSGVLPPLHIKAWTFRELEESIGSVADDGGMILYMPHASVTVPVVASDAT